MLQSMGSQRVWHNWVTNNSNNMPITRNIKMNNFLVEDTCTQRAVPNRVVLSVREVCPEWWELWGEFTHLKKIRWKLSTEECCKQALDESGYSKKDLLQQGCRRWGSMFSGSMKLSMILLENAKWEMAGGVGWGEVQRVNVLPSWRASPLLQKQRKHYWSILIAGEKVAYLQIRGAPLAMMEVKTGTPQPGLGVIDRIKWRRGGYWWGGLKGGTDFRNIGFKTGVI